MYVHLIFDAFNFRRLSNWWKNFSGEKFPIYGMWHHFYCSQSERKSIPLVSVHVHLSTPNVVAFTHSTCLDKRLSQSPQRTEQQNIVRLVSRNHDNLPLTAMFRVAERLVRVHTLLSLDFVFEQNLPLQSLRGGQRYPRLQLWGMNDVTITSCSDATYRNQIWDSISI